MKTSMKSWIASMRRVFPNIDVANARYLYGPDSDLEKARKRIVVYIMLQAEDGRVSMHPTVFEKKTMTVPEWGDWLREHGSKVIEDQVLAYVNRNFGSTWHVVRVFGWRFIGRAPARRQNAFRRARFRMRMEA